MALKLKIDVYADGADVRDMLSARNGGIVRGFTTNPTLMRKAGVVDYTKFADEVLRSITARPISFEVFSDEFDEMNRQARVIAAWGPNVYVKIPITNTRRESSHDLVRRLSHAGVKVNVTAVLTLDQVDGISRCFADGVPGCVSVFAGRVADTGRDPVPLMAAAMECLASRPHVELIWASPRELLNVFQADQIGCHIITVTADLLKKLALVGKDLDEYSLETVKMFHEDARNAGYSL